MPISGGCSSASNATTTTVAPSLEGVLAANPQLSYAAALLGLTQPDDVLRGRTAHTVFVPNNAAIDAYAREKGLPGGKQLVDAVRADPDATGAFVSNFVVDGSATAKTFTEHNGEIFDTRGGVQLTVEISNGVIKLRTSRGMITVLSVDIQSGLTVAHVVDTVIS